MAKQIDLSALSGPKLRHLIGKRYEVRCALLDDTIAAGLGNYLPADMRALAASENEPLARLAADWLAADDAWRQAVDEFEARMRWHGKHTPIKRATHSS